MEKERKIVVVGTHYPAGSDKFREIWNDLIKKILPTDENWSNDPQNIRGKNPEEIIIDDLIEEE